MRFLYVCPTFLALCLSRACLGRLIGFMEPKMAPKNISFPAPAAPVDSQRPRCCLRLQRRVQCSAPPHPTRPLQSRQARDPAPAGSCASALSRLRTSLLGYSGARPSLFGPTTVSYSISDRPSFQRTPTAKCIIIPLKRLKLRLSGSARKSQKRFRDTPMFKFQAVLSRTQPFYHAA